MTECDIAPGTRTADKHLHRDLIGTGHAYLNRTEPIDYDRTDELPPAVHGLKTADDMIVLAKRMPLFGHHYGRIGE